MITIDVDLSESVDKYWLSFGIALFLIVPFDLLTTLFAVTKFGITVEANPIMEWLLSQGMVAVILGNLSITILVVYLFHIAIDGILRAPPEHRGKYINILNLWIATLIIGGVILVTNNLLLLI